MSLLGLFRNEATSTCQEHLHIATLGVHPNFSTFQMALQGFGCSINVDVEVTERPFGGMPGYWEPFSHYKREYDVKFVITTKSGNIIEKQYIYTQKQLLRLEKVVSRFKSGYASILKIKYQLTSAYRKICGMDVKASHLNTTVNQIIIKAKQNDSP